MGDMTVRQIKPQEVRPWLLLKHYARRLCPISYAFGLYDDDILVGVVTYGMPASPSLCVGVCGEKYKRNVIELNRLVIDSPNKNGASELVGKSLRLLPKPTIVVSYADTAQGHVGYVYQATNFLFTGTTKARTDMASVGGKHSRHSKGDKTDRVARSAKHRYVYFCGTKSQKKEMLLALNYRPKPYPKGDTSRYDAGPPIETQRMLING